MVPSVVSTQVTTSLNGCKILSFKPDKSGITESIIVSVIPIIGLDSVGISVSVGTGRAPATSVSFSGVSVFIPRYCIIISLLKTNSSVPTVPTGSSLPVVIIIFANVSPIPPVEPPSAWALTFFGSTSIFTGSGFLSAKSFANCAVFSLSKVSDLIRAIISSFDNPAAFFVNSPSSISLSSPKLDSKPIFSYKPFAVSFSLSVAVPFCSSIAVVSASTSATLLVETPSDFTCLSAKIFASCARLSLSILLLASNPSITASDIPLAFSFISSLESSLFDKPMAFMVFSPNSF